MSDTSITVIYHGMSLTVLYNMAKTFMNENYLPFFIIMHTVLSISGFSTKYL